MTILSETPRFPLGTKYTPIGRKHKILCTVTDFLRTYNSAGELVGTCYVATHDFCGQVMRESDVCETTIARGLVP